MNGRTFRLLVAISAGLVIVLGPAGCGGNHGLPNKVKIELPDGTSVDAIAGAGATSLANSTWDFVQTTSTAQSIAFMRARFGANGNLERFENSTLTRDLFGDEVVFDGRRRTTQQKGLEYAATTFGAQTTDGSGFGFEGRLTAFYAGIQVGIAAVTASGTLDENDPNRMTGSFSFVSNVTLPIDIPNAEQNVVFEFAATRIPEAE